MTDLCKHGHEDWVVGSAGRRVCKTCRSDRSRLWSQAHPEEMRAHSKRWTERHPTERREVIRRYRDTHPTQDRWTQIKYKYGLSPDDWHNLRNQQAGTCAACGDLVADCDFHVDHDHETGKVRALLCRMCNTSLGMLHDSVPRIEKLANYLERSTLAYLRI